MGAQTQISRIETAKRSIFTAIAGKGVDVPQGRLLHELVAYVYQIKGLTGGVSGNWAQTNAGQIARLTAARDGFAQAIEACGVTVPYGTKIDGMAALINQIQVGVDVGAMQINYTGTYTDEIVTMTDGQYRLLTLTGSGTLTMEAPALADIWICGGGRTVSTYNRYGGGGGYVASALSQTIQSIVAAIGAADAVTTVNGDVDLSVTKSSTKKNGGSGGGYDGIGAGVSTYPFEDTAYFQPHCPGGGAGGYYDAYRDRSTSGGYGGSNGSNGGSNSEGGTDGGTGGSYGGGNGGRGYKSPGNGTNGSYYGAGGGGCGSYRYETEDGYETDYGNPGSGYQGVCYVRLPLAQ